MILGVSDLDYKVIKTYIGRPDEFVKYVEGLVPTWATCIPGIIDNQKYYVALCIRNLVSIPYKQRMELAEALIEGVRLTGSISTITPIWDIINLCDKQALCTMLKERYDEQRY